MDREACHVAVHGVTKSQTRLSNWTELNPSLLLGQWLESGLSMNQVGEMLFLFWRKQLVSPKVFRTWLVCVVKNQEIRIICIWGGLGVRLGQNINLLVNSLSIWAILLWLRRQHLDKDAWSQSQYAAWMMPWSLKNKDCLQWGWRWKHRLRNVLRKGSWYSKRQAYYLSQRNPLADSVM